MPLADLEARREYDRRYRSTPEYKAKKREADRLASIKKAEREGRVYRPGGGTAPVPIEERFWPKVDKNGPIHPVLGTRCWIWTACCGPSGYGQIGKPMPGKKAGHVPSHRASWEIHNGPIPDGLWVLHKCDNPPCVNPDHLFLGTVKDNMRDAANKGRIYVPGLEVGWNKERFVTHCPLGHPYNEENTYANPSNGKRCCHICMKINKAKWDLENADHRRQYKRDYYHRTKQIQAQQQ